MSAETGPDSDVTVEFVPLLRRPEDGDWIVGRAPSGPFIALPDLGVEAIDLLAAGSTVAAAAEELHRRHGDPVDVAGFVAGLDRIGLVVAIAGRPTGADRPHGPQGMTLPWLRPEHLRWLPTRGTLLVWCALLIAAAGVLVTDPATRPHRADLVWCGSAAVVTMIGVLVAWAAVVLHEGSHLALARAYGVPGTISLSTRLTFVVAQTDVTGAWALPRRRRILIYLVGMAVELALAALAVLALPALDPAGTAATFLRATVLLLTLGLLPQFTFSLRTDVFFLLQDLTRCRDLYGDARRLLTHWGARLLRRAPTADPRTGRNAHERRTITWYAPLLLAGTVITLAAFVVITVPVDIRLVTVAARNLTGGLAGHTPARIADGVISLAVVIGFNALLIGLTLRKVARATQRAKPA